MDVSPKQLLDQARERFTLKDYFGCIHLLTDLADSGRGYADAFQLLGLAYHLAGEPDLAKELLDKNVRAIAYETVSLDDGSLPILAPMSQIAGCDLAHRVFRHG